MTGDLVNERNANIINMRRAGNTFATIGLQLGISRQRAHQIYKRATITRGPPPQLYGYQIVIWNGKTKYVRVNNERVFQRANRTR